MVDRVFSDIPVFVIHARRLSDRVAHIEKELDRVGLSFTWIELYDPEDIDGAVEARYFNTDNALTPGQKSCALKHLTAMERIRDLGCDSALIFEDDVFLRSDFMERLAQALDEAARDWPSPRILQLGAATNYYTPASQLQPGKCIYVGDKVRFAEAYVIGAKEAAMRLDWIARNRITLPIDLQYNVCDPELGIPFLWVEPPLAEQGSLNGAFKSSLDTKKRPQWRLSLQFPVQKFKRKYLYRWLRLR